MQRQERYGARTSSISPPTPPSFLCPYLCPFASVSMVKTWCVWEVIHVWSTEDQSSLVTGGHELRQRKTRDGGGGGGGGGVTRRGVYRHFDRFTLDWPLLNFSQAQWVTEKPLYSAQLSTTYWIFSLILSSDEGRFWLDLEMWRITRGYNWEYKCVMISIWCNSW